MSEKTVCDVKGFGLVEAENEETLESIYKRTLKDTGFQAVGVRSGNVIYDLADKAEGKNKIEFLSINDPEGMRIYCSGTAFVLIKAAYDVIGKDCRIVIEHTINNNYYCEIRNDGIEITDGLLEKLDERMRELISADLPIERMLVPRDEAYKIYDDLGMDGKARLFKYMRYTRVCMYKLDGFYDYFYGSMLPSTGYVKKFALAKYSNGFLLQFPSVNDGETLQPFENFRKISDVFIEQLKWCSLMHVNNMADLNDCISEGGFEELVRINEALHEKKIAQIADSIAEKIDKVKLVLIAGPSSSGKTSFAQRLCVQLRVNGITPHAIGMDDYFVNRDETPLDENGKPDFENINALDLELFNNHMNALIRGEKVSIPSYNFITGRKEYNGRTIQLKEGDIIVCEGIHGLNDALTSSVPDENKFRIFISAMTQLNIDAHNRVSTSDSRLIRRIVRDNRSRGNSAEKTIETWPSVRRGEEKNIFPFQENADVMFNSATIYELCVLKSHVEPLLYSIDKSKPEYVTAQRLLGMLENVLGADGQCVPNNSLIREFIGGSVFKV